MQRRLRLGLQAGKRLPQLGAKALRRLLLDRLGVITGEADYHLRVVAKDVEAYDRFLEAFLLKLPGVLHVRSNIVLKEIKAGSALPFAG